MILTEGDSTWTVCPRRQPLGKLIKGGGAGSIYSLVDPRPLAAKIFAAGIDLEMLERKLAAMLDAPPLLPDLVESEERQVQFAWPEALLHDRKGRFVGFLMPKVNLIETSELEWVLQERQARAIGLTLGLAAKMVLAANLATTISDLHEHGHRVVDLNPGKLRFHPQLHYTAIVDCDSFSIQGKDTRFAARNTDSQHLTADYLAPEYHDQPVPAEGEESQDRFALAVLVFQLLNFGIHPFTGMPTNDDVPSDIPSRITRGCYAYGKIPNPDMEPSPVSGHEAMPIELRFLFDRAFGADATARPTAAEWAAQLTTYAMPWNRCLQVCGKNAAHQHYADQACAACARAELIVVAAHASDMSLEHVDDPMAPGVHPFGAPKPVAEAPAIPESAEWQAQEPTQLPLPREAASKGLPKGAAIALKAVAALFVVAVLAKQGLAYKSRHAMPAPTQVAELVEAPAGPRPDPDLAGFQEEEGLTEGFALAASKAIAKGDRAGWDKAMATLRGRVPPHPAAPPNPYQAAFATFSASVTPESYNERQRQVLIQKLRETIRENPFDDEAAVEVGWLSLLAGDRDVAKSFYVHAILVNPDRADAWYGFGVVTGDEDWRTGALTTAELLTPDPALAQRMRDAFPPLLLRLCSVKPEYFAMLQSRSRTIAENNRPPVVTPAGPASVVSPAVSPLASAASPAASPVAAGASPAPRPRASGAASSR